MHTFFQLLKSFLFFAVFLEFLPFSASCTYEKRPPVVANVACDTLMPTYAQDIKPIIDINCSYPGCHDAGASIGDFTHYSSMKSRLEGGQFETRVLLIKDMPPPYASGPKELSPEELDLLECWLQDGYPEQ